jgi:hypothetical protein
MAVENGVSTDIQPLQPGGWLAAAVTDTMEACCRAMAAGLLFQGPHTATETISQVARSSPRRSVKAPGSEALSEQRQLPTV